MKRTIKLALTLLIALLATACAHQPVPYDYTALKKNKPKSILVLPPVNSSPDINASYSVLSHLTLPLAESGYYVYPVAVVNETFKQNGLVHPNEIQSVEAAKLVEIFGADTALYIDVVKYGTSYNIISSDVVVSANAKLMDLRTGEMLWNGSATASSAENQAASSSLIALLVTAVVNQIINTTTDQSHVMAGVTSYRLLNPNRVNGLLYGPRSPNYGLN
ncbi:DUF799 domain-containing protein [Deefgea piscis]|uniref:DUF799 domain-containing protein n=1 Tax=Deefgea piscis TaxID=2739061 RepID=A0A6M8SWW5_9NEIS|nr:DUF799 domain-containing protein [Deefgea piscis]QKJ66227.1 DUF799 domain-containing protein [Deefgea piscis]